MSHGRKARGLLVSLLFLCRLVSAASTVDPPRSADQTPALEAAPPQEAEPSSTVEPHPEEPRQSVETRPSAPEKPEPEEKAPSLWPFTFGTSTWSRFEVREGYDRIGVSGPSTDPSRARFQEGDLVAFRARLSMTSGALPLVGRSTGRLVFAPQASGYWGTSGTGGTVGEANLGIYEGYFWLESERIDVKGGRFSMNYGDAVVIGNLGWHQAGRAFDGALVHYEMRRGFVDAFMTSVAEGWPTMNDPIFAGDSYFWGLYAGFGQYISPALDLELYFLGRSIASTSNWTDASTGFSGPRDGATLFTLGSRAKLVRDFWDARVEAGLQFGEKPSTPTNGDTRIEALGTLAYQALAEAGIKPLSALRIAVGGAFASGDDPTTSVNEAYSDLYPTGHKFLGWTDVIGARTNVLSGYLSVTASLTQSLVLVVDGHLFGRPFPGGLGRTGPDPFAGTELDVQLTQKLGKFFSVRALYCAFDPNAGHYANGDLVHFFETQAGLEF